MSLSNKASGCEVTGVTGNARCGKAYTAQCMQFLPSISNGELDTLREKTQSYIDLWTEQRVEACEYVTTVKNTLLEKRWATIVGFPGEGKTSLGCFVLKALEAESKKDVFVISSPQDYDLVSSQCSESVMMFNDLLGTFALDPTAFSTWRTVLTRIFSQHSEKRATGYILLIGSHNVLNEIQEQFARSESSVLINNPFDFSKEISNNKELKEKIFNYHLGEFNFDNSTRQQICCKAHPFGFSFRCKLYAVLRRSTGETIDIIKFFQDPSHYLEQPLRNLFDNVDDRELFKRLLKGGGKTDLDEIDDDDLRLRLRKAEKSLQGCYLKKDGCFTEFVHPLLYASVAFSIGRLDPLFVIKHCSISFILERVRIKDTAEKENKTNDYLEILMSEGIKRRLTERFVCHLRNKEFAVLEFSACRREDFLIKLLREVIQTDDKDDTKLKVDDVDTGESTMLLVAARCGNTTAVRILLAFGAFAGFKSCIHKRTALHYLSMKDHFDEDIIDTFVSCGADINDVDIDGNTALHYMCREGKLGLTHISKLLDCHIDVNKQNNLGQIALQLMCKADTRIQNDEKGKKITLQCNRKDIVELQIDRGAKLTTTDTEGRGPLHSLCKEGEMDLEVMEMMVNPETVNTSDTEGRTPLHYLCQRCGTKTEMVRKLLTSGAKVNHEDKKGKTALHLACDKQEHDVELWELLTQNGADVRLNDTNKKSPFQYLCTDGKAEVAVINFLTTQVDTVIVSTKSDKEKPQILSDKMTTIPRMLLSKDAEIKITTDGGRLELHITTDNVSGAPSMLTHGNK